MPAQKRSHDSSPPPPPQPMEVDVELEEEEEEEEEEEKDGDSHQLNQNGEQADESDDSDGSSSSSDEETEDDKDEAKPEFITVKLSDIRKEVQCPICLGVIRKTRTVMECLHRFCRECIDKSMRLGNNECPACRTHCASRRSLRDDPNYDNIIAYLYPDIDKYEEEELAFHDEEKARNKQIQASIAQTLRRQSEALGRKRSVRATATAFVRRSHNNYRNTRGRRNHRNIDNPGSEEEDDANANDGGKDSSSADEHCQDVKRKRYRRWSGTRISQPSGAANANANANAGCDDNDLEVNRELLGVSAGLVGSSDILAWGKGGMRSHTRHGPPAGANGKFTRNNRISKLMDCLRCSDENSHELDVSLMLVSLYENEVPSLQRPYLCCKPTLSIGQLCQYVSLQTSMSTNEVQIWAVKGSERSSNSIQEIESLTPTPNLDKSEVHPLEESQNLGEIHNNFSFNQGNLVLAYGRKNKVTKR